MTEKKEIETKVARGEVGARERGGGADSGVFLVFGK